tara:strand:+ start:295 stop:522 length:228 start_codon:yes stop_codon:yes gene_type:complete
MTNAELNIIDNAFNLWGPASTDNESDLGTKIEKLQAKKTHPKWQWLKRDLLELLYEAEGNLIRKFWANGGIHLKK